MLSLNEIFSSAICRMLLVGAALSALPEDEREVPSLSSPGRALMSLLQPVRRQAATSALAVEESGRKTSLDNLPAGTHSTGQAQTASGGPAKPLVRMRKECLPHSLLQFWLLCAFNKGVRLGVTKGRGVRRRWDKKAFFFFF